MKNENEITQPVGFSSIFSFLHSITVNRMAVNVNEAKGRTDDNRMISMCTSIVNALRLCIGIQVTPMENMRNLKIVN